MDLKKIVLKIRNSDLPEDDVLKYGKILITEFAKDYHAKQLLIGGVSCSIGLDDYKLETLVRTRENKHLCVCDLCKLKPICTDESELYQKCIDNNTDDQYYC